MPLAGYQQRLLMDWPRNCSDNQKLKQAFDSACYFLDVGGFLRGPTVRFSIIAINISF